MSEEVSIGGFLGFFSLFSFEPFWPFAHLETSNQSERIRLAPAEESNGTTVNGPAVFYSTLGEGIPTTRKKIKYFSPELKKKAKTFQDSVRFPKLLVN